VSSGFGLSRGKAAAAVESGKLELNYLPCVKPDKPVAEGDVISIRGLGKIRLESVAGTTKKGRISIVISRFI
jgi:RNA-binding protein YlmH